MDILIESTKGFEKDLAQLSQDEKLITIQKINDCASLFPAQKAHVYQTLETPHLPSNLNGYKSSLHTLRVSQKLRVILAVDEDPIFEQVIFTLFRVVDFHQLDHTYEAVAESLYQELRHHDRETTQIP